MKLKTKLTKITRLRYYRKPLHYVGDPKIGWWWWRSKDLWEYRAKLLYAAAIQAKRLDPARPDQGYWG